MEMFELPPGKCICRRHSIPIAEAEKNLETEKERAQEQWAEGMCQKISAANSPKEMWQAFKKMTKNKREDIIQPLKDDKGTTIFDPDKKLEILQETFFEGKHLSITSFDKEFGENIRAEYQTETNRIIEDDNLEFYNTPIRMEEVIGALQKLEPYKAAGPDDLFPELLKRSGPQLRKAIHRVRTLSWESGTLPKSWKNSKVKYIKKPGKPDYSEPSAYRPISLTSAMSKTMERIVKNRLEYKVETDNLIDKEQEGFRKGHSTSMALIQLVQSTFNGFNRQETTMACSIDLEKAYDSVWRQGLMVKLSRMGIRGRLWRWTDNFLQERTANGMHQSHVGKSFTTETGLPQGSVISPLLFNLHVADIFEDLTCHKTKFADGATLAEQGTDIETLARKTTANVGTATVEEMRSTVVTADNMTLKYNPCPKLLGVYLDKQLNLDEHAEYVQRKANKALCVLRYLKGLKLVTAESLLKIYVSIVRAHLDYGAAAWLVMKDTSKAKLEGVQRKGLGMCLGLPLTAGREALEVEDGILPLDCRWDESAADTLAKIKGMPGDQPIKKLWDNWRDRSIKREKHLSPFGLMKMVTAEAYQLTGTNVEDIEDATPPLNKCISPSAPRPTYWDEFGSSNSRTAYQQERGRAFIEDHLTKNPPKTVIAFTDGSCLRNPGPCGAGALIQFPYNGEEMEIIKPVALRWSILLAELEAINQTLSYVKEKLGNQDIEKVTIYSDNQCALGILDLNWQSPNYKDTIRNMKTNMERLLENRVVTEYIWSPGHTDIPGNEKADSLAKRAAELAKDLGDRHRQSTCLDIKNAARVRSMER